MPFPTARAARSTLWLAFCAAAALPAAAGFRPGAYADELGTTPVVCVTQQHMASMTATAWKQAMQQRGMDCTVSESARPMPGHETWKARCTGAPRGATSAAALLYQFTVHADGEKLVIDSGAQTPDGAQVMKKALFGTYRGACDAHTPALDVDAYLGGQPHTQGTPAQAAARKAVATDLVRCGNVFNGLSLSVAKARQEGMRMAAAGLLEAAVELHPGEGSFHLDALRQSAPEVSAELVGASPEKRFALYQSCSPYLEPGGIEKAVQGRAATGAAAR
jgi:hypothetical protein